MQNTWIVVPIISNDYDLSAFVNKLTSSYVCPETYTFLEHNPSTDQLEEKTYPHPYAGQNSENFSNRIIFINHKPGYTQYEGITNIEDFGEFNLYRGLNKGIEYAKSSGADSIVLLNGALDLDTFVINQGYKKLVESQKKVINVAANAIILISADCELRFDEQFQIWFADSDFYRVAMDLDEVEFADISFWYIKYLIQQNLVESFDDIVKLDEEKHNLKQW